jgi:two-component system, OmpR family, alkaline phosphatase synthesis response regulator PhoP
MPSPARILYVEDKLDTVELVSFVLRNEGFVVVTVTHPDEAVQLAQYWQFDLYILDNWLAEAPGLELCLSLREFDSITPILFFSGAAYEQDKQKAFECGAQGYLIKPATPEALIAEVRRLLAATH